MYSEKAKTPGRQKIYIYVCYTLIGFFVFFFFKEGTLIWKNEFYMLLLGNDF